MELHHTDEVETYAAAVVPFLEADPLGRNMLRSVLETVRAGSTGWAAPPSFWWGTDGDDVVGAASWTPPFYLLVSPWPAELASPLAESAHRRAAELRVSLPGARGPAESARLVAHAWELHVGQAPTIHRVQLLHRLDALAGPSPPPGTWRAAEIRDVSVLATWFTAFALEARVPSNPRTEAYVAQLITERRCFVWEVDRRSTSMVCFTPPVAGVARIGPVYTPPDMRQRGYARRLTYEVTRELVGSGARTVVLYTDADNRTSNSIYRQIGYVLLEEHHEFAFQAAAPAANI